MLARFSGATIAPPMPKSRVNQRSIDPKKATPHKRDPSHLDWHYKAPTEEELADPYECFPEGFWPPFFQAAKEAAPLSPRQKSDVDILRNQVKKDACSDCSLPYQFLMQRVGKCHPVEGAMTPILRGRRGRKVDVMSDEKNQYFKITSLSEYKYENLEEEWYTIAPTLEEARAIADRIGMPDNRKEQVVYLTDEQYDAIPEAQ